MMKFVSSKRNAIDGDNIYDNILIVTKFNRKEINKSNFPCGKLLNSNTLQTFVLLGSMIQA